MFWGAECAGDFDRETFDGPLRAQAEKRVEKGTEFLAVSGGIMRRERAFDLSRSNTTNACNATDRLPK